MTEMPPPRPRDPAGHDAKIRVMVVDDSAVTRGLIAKVLSTNPLIEIVASVGDGQMALNSLARHDVDVIVLDIEMPVMDGLTALPLILEQNPTVKVIVSSTLSQRNARISMDALQRGASDYLEKPRSRGDLSSPQGYGGQLLERVIALAQSRRGGFGFSTSASAAQPVDQTRPAPPTPPSGTAPSSPRNPASASFPLCQTAAIRVYPITSPFHPAPHASASPCSAPPIRRLRACR